MDLKLIKSKDIRDLKKQIEEIGKKNTELNEEWLNSEQAAEYLGVSVRTLLRIRFRGEIAFTKIGQRARYKKSDLIEYLNDNYFSKKNIEKR